MQGKRFDFFGQEDDLNRSAAHKTSCSSKQKNSCLPHSLWGCPIARSETVDSRPWSRSSNLRWTACGAAPAHVGPARWTKTRASGHVQQQPTGSGSAADRGRYWPTPVPTARRSFNNPTPASRIKHQDGGVAAINASGPAGLYWALISFGYVQTPDVFIYDLLMCRFRVWCTTRGDEDPGKLPCRFIASWMNNRPRGPAAIKWRLYDAL